MGRLFPTALALVGLGVAFFPGVPRPAAAQTPEALFLFSISKSENRNQVHYAARVDKDCQAASRAPVYAYWRMFERGPLVTEPLLAREEGLYGVASQEVRDHTVTVRLAALRDRPLTVVLERHGQGCRGSAVLPIGGVPAALENVHAQLAWPFGVESLTLSGRAILDGRPRRERLTP